MSTLTPNLSLTKPAGSESADIAVINANSDILDNAVTLTGSQTLTNKTLTSPHMTTPVVDSGGLTVTSGGLTVSSGTTNLLATVVTGNLTVTGAVSFTGSTLGFYNTSPVGRPNLSGSRGGNAALTTVCTALAALGLCADGTTA